MGRIAAFTAIVLLAASHSQRVSADSAVQVRYTDYLAADTRSKAEALWRNGELERVLLFPLDGGGEDVDLNVVYVPKHAAAAKAALDKRILGLAAQGQVADYEAAPVYRESSFIPTRIVVRALTAEGRVVLEETIDIW